MSEHTFEEKVFLKHASDEFFNLSRKMFISNTLSRRIRTAVYADTGLRELATNIRYEISNIATDILNLINNYKKFYNISDASNKDVYEKLSKAVKEFRIEMKLEHSIDEETGPFNAVVTICKDLIKTCDRINDFNNLAYKIESSEETKFNTATAESIIKENMQLHSFCNELEKIEAEMKTKNISVYSPEYGKIISKRLKALKGEVLSIVNKYFGQSSRLGEFNIMKSVF
jgi:hypothetical protein